MADPVKPLTSYSAQINFDINILNGSCSAMPNTRSTPGHAPCDILSTSSDVRGCYGMNMYFVSNQWKSVNLVIWFVCVIKHIKKSIDGRLFMSQNCLKTEPWNRGVDRRRNIVNEIKYASDQSERALQNILIDIFLRFLKLPYSFVFPWKCPNFLRFPGRFPKSGANFRLHYIGVASQGGGGAPCPLACGAVKCAKKHKCANNSERSRIVIFLEF